MNNLIQLMQLNPIKIMDNLKYSFYLQYYFLDQSATDSLQVLVSASLILLASVSPHTWRVAGRGMPLKEQPAE